MDTPRPKTTSLADKQPAAKRSRDLALNGLAMFGGLLMTVAGAAFVGGFSVPIYQVSRWLKDGSWPHIRVDDGITFFGFWTESAIRWLQNPTDWYGVVKAAWFILQSPLSVVLIMVGFILMPIGGIFYSSPRR